MEVLNVLEQKIAGLIELIKELRLENAQLKDQLKSCRPPYWSALRRSRLPKAKLMLLLKTSISLYLVSKNNDQFCSKVQGDAVW